MAKRYSSEAARELELVVRRAFAEAEKWRAAKDLPRRIMTKRVRKRGIPDGPIRWHGPTEYKVTLWLPPWSYLELLDRKRAAGFPGSLHRYIEKELGLKTAKERRQEIEARNTQKRHATG